MTDAQSRIQEAKHVDWQHYEPCKSCCQASFTPPIHGLLIDICGVLYDDSIWRRWLLQLVTRIGLHTHYTSFFRVWEREYLVDVNCGRREYWQALRAFLLAAGLTSGQIDEVLAAGHARYRHFEQGIRPLPHVSATLAQLAALGTQLAIIGNGPWTRSQLQQRIQLLRLPTPVDVVLSSLDIGRSDPNANRYEVAVSCMQLPAEQVAFVTCDCFESAAAAAVGIQSVTLDDHAHVGAARHIDRFDQLPSILPLQAEQVLAG